MAADRGTDPPETQEEPEMREEDVLACAFGAWYERYRPVTFKSEVLPLPEEFVRYLLADGIQLAAGDDDGASSSGSSWGDGGEGDAGSSSDGEDAVQDSFPELEARIGAAIERLGGSVLPKLNWSAPKDARWLQSTLKCSTAQEVITLLKASDFVSHDLCHSFDHCATSRTRPDEFTLVLRRWRDLHESNEFRCFVSDACLFAISQRQASGLFEHLSEQAEQDALRREIENFFEQHLRSTFPLRRYVVDVYVAAAPQRKMRLVDFSPWGPSTDPCLFDWPELTELARGARGEGDGDGGEAEARRGPPEFRVVREEADRRAKAEKYSQLPLELAQLSAGEGLEDLIRKADRLLQAKSDRPSSGGPGGEGR